MKLTDLDPRWWAEPGRTGQGITFLCPHCKTTRLAVAFANPLDAGERFHLGKMRGLVDAIGPGDWVPPGFHWGRLGETFEALTLAPSVDASASGHWHGFITNGEVVTA